MTVATYTSDLTDLNLFENTDNITATGGGGAGLSASPEFAMEGTNAVDKKVDAAEKGFMWDKGTSTTLGTNDHVYAWLYIATPGINATGTGLRFWTGDTITSRVGFAVAQIDITGAWTVHRDLSGDAYAVKPRDGNAYGDGNVFIDTPVPGGSPQWFGVSTEMTVSVSDVNLAMDGLRYGSGYDVLHGTSADPEANFAGIESDDSSTSEGILIEIPGGYTLQGRIRIGDASNACEFLDSGLLIATKVTGHARDDFTAIIIEHASSIVNLTNVTFLGQHTYNRGRFEVITSGATVNLTNCVFQNYGPTVLGTGSTCLNCSWINADVITANGADLTGSLVRDFATADSGRFNEPSTSVVNTSPLIWNVATDPDGLLDDMTFVKGSEATHAIEFGLSSPLTMTLTGMDFSGYNASNAQNDSTFHIKRTTGTVTLNINSSLGEFSYRTDGAVVVIVISPVTLTIAATDIGTSAAIENVRVFITPEDNTGPFPFEESVTLTQVSNTVTAVHTAHGMINSQDIQISGANEPEYNGVYAIANVTANGYEYTITGDPASPATGTIIGTAVIIDGLTNVSGVIADTRSYTSDQPITGRARKSSASPFYKTSPVTGTIDSDDGLSIAVQMIRDE